MRSHGARQQAKLARSGAIEAILDAGHGIAAEGILWLPSTRGDNIPRTIRSNRFFRADCEPLRCFPLPPCCPGVSAWEGLCK